MSDFPKVLFPPGNIVINLSMFVFDYALIANQNPKVFAVLTYVIMTENSRFLSPAALDNRYPHQARLSSQQACQRPGEEAQVNDPRQTSPR